MLDAVSEPTASAGSQPTGSSAQTRRVAAIDIGTNSTHLLVASVDTTLGTFSIEQAEKSTTRLGERDPDSGELTSAGYAARLRNAAAFPGPGDQSRR